ncbi:rhomboid family intramembrane serine protease [uncultured Dokdonia sp.]|uniref:rhomboid family intramembrane serine protease n=1 Tax=uncultured Dokdonia sp. TaxID=575653 RepID=UPI00260F08EA|nr:rhomboid family intramembrane serine protease [uncultured Dokdonia sp.]
MGRITDTVKVLLIINVIFFLGSQFVEVTYQYFSLWFPYSENFRVWQVFTHMFMHADVLHIFFNMFMLYMFGSHLENILGKNKLLILYFSAGLGSMILHLGVLYLDFWPGYDAMLSNGMSIEDVNTFLKTSSYPTSIAQFVSEDALYNTYTANRNPMLGASGAVFGLLAGFMILFPNLELMVFPIPIPVKAKYLIGGYFLLNVYSAITGHSIIGPSNTAYWAHIGGALIGFIMMYYWKKNSFNNKRWN